MMKYILIFLLSINLLNAGSVSAELVREKKEVIQLKKDLNQFYNKKEKEYKKRKKDLLDILSKIEKEKQEIKTYYNENLNTLKDIKGLVSTKTTKVYNGMKPKTSSRIFDKMIEDGEIDDVFAIILKLKEKKISSIMKFLSIENSAEITKMLQNFKAEKGR